MAETKADRARALILGGMSVADTAREVGAHYSQVHSIYRAMMKSQGDGATPAPALAPIRARSRLRPKVLASQPVQQPASGAQVNHDKRRKAVARAVLDTPRPTPPVRTITGTGPKRESTQSRTKRGTMTRATLEVEDPLLKAWHKAQDDCRAAKEAGDDRAHRTAVRHLIEADRAIGARAMGRKELKNSLFGGIVIRG